MEFLKEEKVRVLPWPAKSPDLNRMENMWSIVKRRIRGPLSATEGHAVLGRHVSRTDGERWSGPTPVRVPLLNEAFAETVR